MSKGCDTEKVTYLALVPQIQRKKREEILSWLCFMTSGGVKCNFLVQIVVRLPLYILLNFLEVHFNPPYLF